MNDYEKEIPVSKCPKCGAEYDDYDGAGISWCPACGHCDHSIISHGRCALCGEVMEKTP